MIRTFVIGKPKKIMQHLDSNYWRKKVQPFMEKTLRCYQRNEKSRTLEDIFRPYRFIF